MLFFYCKQFSFQLMLHLQYKQYEKNTEQRAKTILLIRFTDTIILIMDQIKFGFVCITFYIYLYKKISFLQFIFLNTCLSSCQKCINLWVVCRQLTKLGLCFAFVSYLQKIESDKLKLLQILISNRKTGIFSIPKPKKVPRQIQQIEIDEFNSIANDQSQELNKVPSSFPASCNPRGESLALSLSENKNSCSKWTYMFIFCVLVIFLTVEYVGEIQIKYQNTKQFIQNLKQLRDSSRSFEANRLKTVSLQGSKNNQVIRQQQQFNFNGIPAQGIQFNYNQPDPQQINSNSASLNPSFEVSRQSVPDSKPQPTPSFAYFTQQNEPINPIVSNHHPERNENIYNAPVPVPKMENQNNLNSQSFTNIQISNSQFSHVSYQFPNQPWRQIKVSPTIKPWTSYKVPQSANPFATFAGILPELITQASGRQNLVDSDNYNQPNPIAEEQKRYFQSKYKISTYEQLPFCIVVPTFNNAAQKRYLNNIKSILMQDYNNYHIVVIDDHSTDGTGALIKKQLERQNKIPVERYKIITNNQQMRAMVNIRTAAKEHCRPQQIFMIVDGDDELLGRQVLKLFNSIFQEKKLWFVYSNFLTTGGSVGFSRPFPQSVMQRNTYRSYPFVTSHLRAFYTKLLLNIKEEDLKDDQGAYLKAANDVAICIPILEQSHERAGYIPEFAYYYNSNTGINNHIVRLNEQRANQQTVRRRNSYKRLENLLD